jgi:hypothetical protein
MCRFDEFDKNFAIVMDSSDGPIMFGVEEQISLYRLAAMRHFIYDEVVELEEVHKKAKLLATKSKIAHNHLMISSINAMALFATGDYRRAFEAASVAYAQFSRREFIGIFGPLESHVCDGAMSIRVCKTARGVCSLSSSPGCWLS